MAASLILVSHSYPPVLGGSEMEAQRVCAALIRRGHRVTVLCAGGAPMPDVAAWVDPAGVPVRIFGRRFRGRFRDYAFALGVASTLFRRRRDYQLVYFLMQGLHLAAGLPVARALGKPIVMKVSGSSLLTIMRESRLGRLELRWLRKWARRVMILNKGMAEEAAAAGLEARQLVWMPNPVDTEEFAPCNAARKRELRAELGLPDSAKVVVFVGRLAPEKELPSLVGAFKAVAERVPGAALVLVGEGPCLEELQALARRDKTCGLPWAGQKACSTVRFVGRQPVERVREWLQAGDVFALVSSNEGFPCSLVEAMSAGLASIVSDIPANAQLIDSGVHGVRVPVRDEARLAEALVGLLCDDEQRERMGRAARGRVVENYSTEKVIERYEELFGEVLGDH